MQKDRWHARWRRLLSELHTWGERTRTPKTRLKLERSWCRGSGTSVTTHGRIVQYIEEIRGGASCVVRCIQTTTSFTAMYVIKLSATGKNTWGFVSNCRSRQTMAVTWATTVATTPGAKTAFVEAELSRYLLSGSVQTLAPWGKTTIHVSLHLVPRSGRRTARGGRPRHRLLKPPRTDLSRTSLQGPQKRITPRSVPRMSTGSSRTPSTLLRLLGEKSSWTCTTPVTTRLLGTPLGLEAVKLRDSMVCDPGPWPGPCPRSRGQRL